MAQPIQVKMRTVYEAVCRDATGRIKWVATAHNIVVTAGLNKLLDATFKTGLAAPLWYVGLKSTGTPDPADTMASHVTWTELTAYDEAARPAWTPGAISAGSVSNTGAKARFTASGNMTILGLFLTDIATKAGATGTLYGAADFSEGTRTMVDNDTLDVTATLTAAAA
jgi:hypothetical protein